MDPDTLVTPVRQSWNASATFDLTVTNIQPKMEETNYFQDIMLIIKFCGQMSKSLINLLWISKPILICFQWFSICQFPEDDTMSCRLGCANPPLGLNIISASI